MVEPLTRPAHLSPPRGSWLAPRKLAAAAAALGALAFVVVAVAAGELGATPDWRISAPGFAATALVSALSLARREPGGYRLWLIGLGLAGASLVLGWFLMVAIVIGATAVVILILHALM